MKTVFVVLLLALVVLTRWDCDNAQDLQRIVPLKSTRADVERLFGPAKPSYGVIYQLKTVSLFVEYSSGPCRPGRKGGWECA
jgi:hypothetical protein